MKQIHILSQGLAEARLVKSLPGFKSGMAALALEPNGHKFKVGDTCTLVGLQSVPQYNGLKVKIVGLRQDGNRDGVPCRAYYVEGDINEEFNWVFEDRLQ